MNPLLSLTRRDLLKAGIVLGGGLVLGIRIPERAEGAGGGARGVPASVNPFLRIGTDGSVTVIMSKTELGQGIHTALAMLVAEELSCPWESVRAETAPVDPIYNHTRWDHMGTGGSTSVWSERYRYSLAGATAREMLVATAAARWGISPEGLRAADGRVTDGAGRSLGFGELAEAAAALPVPQVELKGRKDWRILGKEPPRLDTPEKVSGAAVFGIDVRLPGMVTALVARPPTFGGKAAKVRDGKARRVPGVRAVVEVPSGVAVIADDFHSARKGREALDVDWADGPGAAVSTARLREEYAKLSRLPGSVAWSAGDAEGEISRSAARIEAEYEVPYLAHAPMEPLNCVVRLPGDGTCEIWTGSAGQTWDRDRAAQIAELPPDRVTLHTMPAGGGFGRRSNPVSDVVSEAVHVAVAWGKAAPVRVVWTREDDIRGGYYRPMFHHRLVAAIGSDGAPSAWTHTLVGQSIQAGTGFMPDTHPPPGWVDRYSVEGAVRLPYDIPHVRVDVHSPVVAVPVQWFRSVGFSFNCFVVESFLDEAAASAKRDPLSLRLALLGGQPRIRAAVERAAEAAGWGKPLPAGAGRGMALHEAMGTVVAQVAEVSRDVRGEVRVHRVVCAVDCGAVVHPGIVERQMESGIAFGLSAALSGEITLKEGRVEQDGFGSYPPIRMDRMPRVEVHVLDTDNPSTGVGERGVPPIAPAVANALFSATGERRRVLPLNRPAAGAPGPGGG